MLHTRNAACRQKENACQVPVLNQNNIQPNMVAALRKAQELSTTLSEIEQLTINVTAL